MHVWEVACSFFLSAVLQLKILYKFLPVNICMMQPIGSINERFQGLCLKDSGALWRPFYSGISSDTCFTVSCNRCSSKLVASWDSYLRINTESFIWQWLGLVYLMVLDFTHRGTCGIWVDFPLLLVCMPSAFVAMLCFPASILQWKIVDSFLSNEPTTTIFIM